MAGKTPEETIAILNTKARADGDSFWLKVYRKRAAHMLPEAACTLSDATVLHAASVEAWLPRLAGGGPLYVISVYHANDPTVPLGDQLMISIPVENCPPIPPGEMDVSLLKQPGWAGPRNLIWPTAADRKQAQTLPGYSVPGLAPGAPSAVAPVATQQGFSTAAEFARLEVERRLDTERERFREMQRELADEKRKIELENLRREQEMRIREMEAKMMATVQQAPKGPDVVSTIATVLTAVGPLIQQMMASQNDMRLAIMKQQEAAAVQQQNMLQVLMQRPSIDPAVEKAFDRMQNILEKSRDNQPGSTMVHSMMESMSMMSSTMLDFFNTASEINLGGGQRDDHPALKAIKQGVKAMNELFAGYQKAAVPALPTAATVHPQQPPTAEQSLAYQEQVAAYKAAQAAAYQEAQAAAYQEAQAAQAAQVAQAPVQAPTPTPPVQVPMGVMGRLEALVTGKAPVAQVAQAFIASLGEPEVQAALEAVGNNINELIAQRLGGWIASNPIEHGVYLKALMDEVERQGAAAGIFEDEEEDAVTDEDEDL